MSQYDFNVSLDPNEAIRIIKSKMNADLIHEELFVLGEDSYIGILIFEKYYFRAENRAGLTVIVDNTKGRTRVQSIASGSSKGILFNFDWGAGADFARSMHSILREYTI